jgi:hypothetical protein
VLLCEVGRIDLVFIAVRAAILTRGSRAWHSADNNGAGDQCFCPDFKRAGISRLHKENGREQFWPKKGNLCCTRKNFKNENDGQNFTHIRVNKMISHKL